ncbi:MAG: FAD-binding oxidoreductase, partial [Solirubrobacteraceae bacterium]
MALARPSVPREEISWSGWGDPAQASALPDTLQGLLRDALGISPHSATQPPAVAGVALASPRLDRAIEDELRALLGTEHVHS